MCSCTSVTAAATENESTPFNQPEFNSTVVRDELFLINVYQRPPEGELSSGSRFLTWPQFNNRGLGCGLNVSPLTHIEDEEAEGAEDDGPHLLPVHGQAIPLRLVLQHKSQHGADHKS